MDAHDTASGWDFSFIAGRMTETPLRWDYGTLVRERFVEKRLARLLRNTEIYSETLKSASLSMPVLTALS